MEMVRSRSICKHHPPPPTIVRPSPGWTGCKMRRDRQQDANMRDENTGRRNSTRQAQLHGAQAVDRRNSWSLNTSVIQVTPVAEREKAWSNLGSPRHTFVQFRQYKKMHLAGEYIYSVSQNTSIQCRQYKKMHLAGATPCTC